MADAAPIQPRSDEIDHSTGLRATPTISWELGLVLATWCALVAWRPFVLGFYHDDWAVVVGSDYDLGRHLNSDPTRALFVLLLFFLKLALGQSSVMWQAGLALGILGAGLGIYAITTRLFSSGAFGPSGSKWGGALAASAWMSAPWSHGYAAFPIMLPPILGGLLVLLGGMLVLFSGLGTTRRMVIFGGSLLASGLCYESFWLSSVPVTLLYAVWSYRTRDFRCAVRETVGLTIVGTLAQLALVALNRLMDTVHNASRVSDQWPATIEADRVLLGQQLPAVLGDALWPVAAGSLLMLVAALWAIRRWSHLLLFACTSASLGVAVALVAVLYALGGYSLQWVGLEARTTLSLNVWLSIGVALVSYYGFHSPNKGRPAFLIGAALLLAGLGRASVAQTAVWSDAWRFEQALLKAVPVGELRVDGSQFGFLVEVPPAGPVTTFGAFWDISGALRNTYPEVWAHPVDPSDLEATVVRPDMLTRWDGEYVSQEWCRLPGSTLWSYRAKRLILWAYPETHVVELTAPYAHGCDGS